MDIAPIGGDLGHVDSVDQDAAGVRVLETGDQLQRRRLAGAARAEDREELAAADGEVRQLQGRRGGARIGLRDVLELDDPIAGGHRHFFAQTAKPLVGWVKPLRNPTYELKRIQL